MLSLKMVKGAELADGVAIEVRLPEPLTRFSIGRDPANQWPIPDRTLAISARHCEVVATADGPALRDLSTNGTFVNGGSARLAGDHLLRDGDRIELGPYTILVQSPQLRPAALPGQAMGAASAAHAPAHSPAPSPAPATPAATRPTPLGGAVRGGDPAAMLSGGGPARPGLTEILRSAPPADDHNLAVTKIRAAPKPPPAPPMRSVALKAEVPPAQAPKVVLPPGAAPHTPPAPPRPAPSPPPVVAHAPVPAPAPARPAGATADPMLRQLAQGLGLPADALAGRDPVQTATQVGQLARAGVMVLRHLLDLQAQARRQIGSRGQALLPVREVNPLRLAASPEAALQSLLAPGADVQSVLQRSAGEIAAHDKRLMAAYRGAAQRMGQELAPEALQAAMPGMSGMSGMSGASETETKARLWDLYQQLWQGMGLAPDQPWTQGFVEAALLHLAAAYDEHGKETAQ